MKNALLALSASLWLALPAAAQFQAGVNETFGSSSYKETNVHATVYGAGFSLAPELDLYTSNASPATFKTISARAGFDTSLLGLGVTAGTTLKSAGYSNAFAGADAAMSLTAAGLTAPSRIGGNTRTDAPMGKGLARVDFGAGVLGTRHAQDGVSDSLLQTDLDGFVGVSFVGTLLSGRLTKSSYNHTPGAFEPSPNRVSVVGLLPMAGAYPDTSLHLRGEFPLPLMTPYVSWTRTTYATLASGAAPGTTRAFAVGVSVGLQMLQVNGAWQHVSVTGGSDGDYINVGAGLRF